MTIEYKDSKRISALSSDLEGLKAYWKMNDSSGKLLNTASSQGNTALSGSDLTVSGTTGYGVTGHVSGVNAYSFTNADGNKAVADNSASDWNFLTNSGNKFTITLWLKVDSNSVNADFIGTGGSGANDFGIRYRGGVSDKKFAIFFSNEGEKITSTSTTLTDTNWHFYMIQYDDSVGTLKFQKDAVAVEEFTGLNLTSTGNPTTALSFGDSQGSTSETGGDMQEVTVWDRLLTTAEIAQIYNSNSGAQLQNTTIETGGRPTDVQDNSLYIEKDTARRYWFDAGAESNVELTTGAPFTAHAAGWQGKAWISELSDLPNVGDVVTGGKIYVGTSAGNVRLGLYSDNGSGVPQTLLAETASTAVGSAGAWQEIDFISSYTTTSTDKLHLGLQTDSSGSGFGYATNVSLARSEMVTSYGAFPTTFSGTSDNTPADLRAVVERPAAPTWTKQQPQLPTVSGLYVHYDATDVDSITKDSNNRISQWNDKSGGARHLTQATSGNQPLWIESDQVGNPVIDFVGDRYMSDTWSAQSLPNTIFIVTVMPTATGSRTNIISGSGSNAQSVFGDGSNTWKYAAGSAQGGTKSGIEGTWQDIYALYGDDYTFEINGDLVSGANCGSDTWAGMEVGASSGSQFGNMKIGEIIGYNTAIKGTDKTTILDYLKAKWGLS